MTAIAVNDFESEPMMKVEFVSVQSPKVRS